jgi:hypothetical protein
MPIAAVRQCEALPQELEPVQVPRESGCERDARRGLVLLSCSEWPAGERYSLPGRSSREA